MELYIPLHTITFSKTNVSKQKHFFSSAVDCGLCSMKKLFQKVRKKLQEFTRTPNTSGILFTASSFCCFLEEYSMVYRLMTPTWWPYRTYLIQQNFLKHLHDYSSLQLPKLSSSPFPSLARITVFKSPLHFFSISSASSILWAFLYAVVSWSSWACNARQKQTADYYVDL